MVRSLPSSQMSTNVLAPTHRIESLSIRSTPLPVDDCTPCGLAGHARDVTHLAPGAGVALAVDVDVGAALRDQLGPALDLVADQVFHDRAAAHQPGDPGR